MASWNWIQKLESPPDWGERRWPASQSSWRNLWRYELPISGRLGPSYRTLWCRYSSKRHYYHLFFSFRYWKYSIMRAHALVLPICPALPIMITLKAQEVGKHFGQKVPKEARILALVSGAWPYGWANFLQGPGGFSLDQQEALEAISKASMRDFWLKWLNSWHFVTIRDASNPPAAISVWFEIFLCQRYNKPKLRFVSSLVFMISLRFVARSSSYSCVIG